MAKQLKAWIANPTKTPKTSVSDSTKVELETKAAELIKSVLKPKHVLPQPSDQQFNYVSDIGVKWNKNYFYFVATYACPGQNAISPSFESNFARMEHLGDGKFTLAFMRHTNEWVALDSGISIDECLKAIQDDPWFLP